MLDLVGTQIVGFLTHRLNCFLYHYFICFNEELRGPPLPCGQATDLVNKTFLGYSVYWLDVNLKKGLASYDLSF